MTTRLDLRRTLQRPARPRRSHLLGWLLACVLALLSLPWAPAAHAQPGAPAPLATGQILVVGLELRPGPASQVVPRNTGTIVSPLLVRADHQPGQPAGELPTLPPDAVFLGELRGPAFQTPVTISAPPNGNFTIPPLPLDGLYTLSDIRLVSGGQVVLAGQPGTVQIEVIEKVIVSQVTARPLTAQEIQDRGIVIDEDNFQVVDFTIGLGLQDEKVKITFPVIVPKRAQGGVPGVPLIRSVGFGGPVEPVEAPLPDLRLVFNSPNVELSGFSLEVPEPDEGKQRPLVDPLPGVVIIPGNVAYLNQFFSVMLKVSNVSPAYSNLSVRNLQAEIVLPPGDDKVAGTSDDPLRMARLGDPPEFQSKVQPVVQVGPDGSLGTADDIALITPQTSGDGEFLVEGRREGIHTVTIVMTGTLEGLPGGPIPITGRAAGVVEVRNPQFSLTFHHPSVVTAGEEYNFEITVTNVGQTPANFVALSLLPSSLSGATLLSEQVQHVETIEAGDAAVVKYRLRALKTGAVVATSLASPSITGRFDLRMAVGELGIPMSPNTLVLPPAANSLPENLRSSAVGLLGQAYALATAPVPPPGLLPLGREMVIERAVDVAAAGQRRGMDEPLPDMARDLALDVMGNNYTRIGETQTGPRAQLMRNDYRAFDELFRKSRRGAEFTGILSALMAPAVSGDSILGFQAGFASAAASRPGFVQAVLGDDDGPAPAVLAIADTLSNRLGMTEAGGPVLRAIPYGNFFTFSNENPYSSQMALIAVPQAARHVAEIAGTASGEFDLGLVVPEGSSLRRVTFENVPVVAGTKGRVVFTVGATNTYVLVMDADGDGSDDTTVQPTVNEIVQDRGPQPVSAIQVFIPTPRSHPSKYGVLLSVLFDEEISRASSEEEADEGAVTNFTVDENQVRATKLQPRGRVLYMYLRDGVGPFVDRSLTMHDVEDRLGNVMAPISQTLPISTVLNGPAGTLEGTVRRADGTPVPGAHIYYEAREMDINDEGYYVLVSAKQARPDGTYSFDYIPTNNPRFTYIDEATNERGIVGLVPRFNGDRMHVDFVLRGRGTLAGRVVQQNGSPATRATVTVRSLYAEADEQGYQLEAEPDGTFIIGGIPVGPISVSAVDVESRSQVVAALEIPAPNATVVTTLTVLPVDQPTAFGAVQGRVFRGDGATPADGIPVYTSRGGMVHTDANGFYRIEGLPIALDGSEVTVRAIDEARLEQADVRTSLVPSATVTANLILFGGTGTVRGVVLDAENVPVPDVFIYGGYERVTTGPDGSFVLPNMPLRSIQITAVDEAAGLMQSASAQLTRPGEEVYVTIVMPVQGTITGRIFKPDGKTPVPNLKIFVLGPKNNIGYTAADGSYTFDKLPRGEYTISAFYPDFSDGNVTFTKIVFKDEVRVANVVFRGRGAVTGIVYDDDGVTPVGARVGLSEWLPKIGKLRPAENPLCLGSIEEGGVKIELPKCEDVVVEWEFKNRARRINNEVSSGAFAFNNVFVGKVVVEAANAFSPGAVSVPTEIPSAGATVPVTLSLQSTSVVTGTVYDIDGTTPVTAGVIVELDAGFINDVRVATDAQGRFSFPLTNYGGFQLQAIDTERDLTGFTSGNTQPGQTVGTTIRLLRKGSVTVDVNGVGGPVAGAAVQLREGARTAGTRSGVTGPDGTLTFQGGDAINEGLFSVSVVKDGVRGSASGTLGSIADDPTGHVTVTVTLKNEVASVAGRFLRTDGVTPIPNAQIVLQGPDGRLFATTDALGAYRFDGIPLGLVTLTGSDPVTGRRGSAAGSLAANGQVLTLDMIQLAQGSVTGIVRRSTDGSAIPGAPVRLEIAAPFGGTLNATSNAAGQFTFPAVPAASFALAAQDLVTGNNGRVNGSLSREGEVVQLDVTVQTPLAGTVRGTVTGPDGNPSFGATVRTTGGNQTTVDDSGVYTITGVRLGNVDVFVDSATKTDGAHATTTLAFNGDVATVNFQLRGTATVRGEVFNANGTRAPFAQVRATRVKGYPAYNKATTADAGGVFTFTLAPVHPLQFTAQLGDLGGSALVTPTQAGSVFPLTMTLEAAGSVAGRVVREDGAPAGGIALELLHGGQVVRFGSTAASGIFTFTQLPLDTYTLDVSDPLGAGIAAATAIVASQGQTVTLGDIVLDDAPPTVVAITPTNGALHVPVNQVIRVRFSEPVDPATATSTGPNANLQVFRGASAVAGSWALSENNTLASFTANAAYPDFATVSVRVKTGIKDRVGRGLPADTVAAFTTTDSTPPAIASRSPLSGATNVPIDAVIRIAWSEPVDAAQFAAAPLRLLRDGQPVAAGTPTLILNNTTAVLVPAGALQPNSTYAVVIPPQRDAFGNTTGITETYTFRSLDLVPPVISSLAAPSGTTVRAGSTALVVATVDDPADVTQVEFFVDGQSRATDTSAPFEYLLSVPSGFGGSTTVSARALDTAGNASTAAALAFTVEPDLAPTVTVRTVPTGTVASGGRITVTVSGRDDTGLGTIFYQATGAATGSGSTPVPNATVTPTLAYTATYVLNVPSNAMPGGVIAVQGTARDTQNQLSPARVVTLTITDASAPVATFLSPAPNSRLDPGAVAQVVARGQDNGAVAAFQLTATGAASFTSMTYVSPPRTPVTATLPVTVPANAPSNGIITLQLRAFDAAGNPSAPAALLLRVRDVISPSASISAQGGVTEVLAGGSVVLTVQGSDDAGVTRVTLNGAGAFTHTQVVNYSPSQPSVAPNFTVAIPPTITNGSLITFTATVRDEAGNEQPSAPLALRIVADSPPTAALSAPAQVDTGAQLTVTVTASDDNGLTRLSLSATGAVAAAPFITFTDAPTTAAHSFVFDVPASAKGSIVLRASATDARAQVGQSAPFTVTVVDRTLPTAIILSPSNNHVVTPGTVQTIQAQGTDNSGVASLTMTVTGAITDTAQRVFATPSTAGTHFFTVTIPATITPNSLITVTLTARDTAGNDSAPDTIVMRAKDTVAPVPSISLRPGLTEIAQGASFTATVAATDNVGVTTLYYRARGGYFSDVSAGVSPARSPVSHTFTINVPANAAASSVITLTGRAIDAANNLAESAPITLTVVRPPLYVTGVVRDAAGEVVAGAAITVTASNGANFTTTTDASGAYTVTGITAGFTTVRAQAPNGLRGSNTGTLASGNPSVFINVTIPDPPQVAITAPLTGTTVVQGAQVGVNASASSVETIARVVFQIGGVAVFTDTVAPYAYNFTVPGGVNELLLGAQATDGEGNRNSAAPVRLIVIADTLTTVQGRVVDSNSAPVEGATVTVDGAYSATSAADGTFSIPGVPTAGGTIQVIARITRDGLPLQRAVTVMPVAGGVTDLGDMVVQVAKFWDGGGGNQNWNVAANWNDNTLPVATDDVYIPITATVNVNASATVNSVRSDGLLRLTIGTLALAADSQIARLSLEGSTLTTAAPLTVTQHFSWTGGTLSGAGRTVSLGTMNVSSGAVPWLDAHLFENRGSAVWQLGTNFILQNGARVINAPGATLQVASVTNEYVLASNSGALPVIENRGVFTVTGSAPLRTTAIFSNTGVLDVAPGATFKIDRANSASDGLLRVQGGATLDLQEPVPVRGSVQIDGVLRSTQGAVTWQPAAAQFGPDALVHVNGGTLTLAGPLTTPALHLQTGTINGAATITATQHFTWAEGTMSGAGRTVTLGRMRLSGTQNWWLEARTLENRGDALWSLSSGFVIQNGARIVNAPGATWTLQSQGSERNVGDNSGAPGLIDNRGLLQVSGGVNLRFNSRLENSGVIDVQAATLRVTLGGVNSGALRVQEGATADFGASYTLGGTLNLSGTLQTSTSAPTLTYQPTAAIFGPQGVIRHVGGVFTVGSDQTVARLVMTAGTLNGSAAITATQHLTWTGGTMEGTGRTASTGRMSFSSNNLFVNQRTLENRGTARFALADGNLYLSSGARLVNAPGATLTVDAPSGQLREIGWQNNEQPTFDNQGLLVKAGAGTVRLRPHFNHGGVAEVQAGTLELYDTGATTGSATGSFIVSNGALLHFSDDYTLDPGSNVSGPGNVRFSASVIANGGYAISGVTTVSLGTVTFGPATQPQLGSQLRIESSGNAVLNSAGPLLLPQLVLVGGELRGSASISVTEVMTWTGGTIRAGGPIAVHNRLDLPSTTTVHLDGRTLENRGTARLPLGGTFQMSNGARLVNAAGATMTFDLSADRSVTFSQGTVTPSLENYGHMVKRGAGKLTLSVLLANESVLDLDAGTLLLNAAASSNGTINVAAGSTLDLSSAVTFGPASTVAGAGAVSFRAAATLNGAYTVSGTTGIFSGGNVLFPPASAPQLGGLLYLEHGTLTVDSATGLSVPRLHLATNGTLTGSATVTATDVLTWTAGTMAGSGRTVALTRMEAPTTANLFLNTRTLENRGQAAWQMSHSLYGSNGARLINAAGATLDVQALGSGTTERQFVFYLAGVRPVFDNYGTFVKFGTQPLDVEFVLNNSGIVEAQQGLLRLDGTGRSPSGTMLRVEQGATAEVSQNYAISGTLGVSGTLQLATTSANGLTLDPANATFGPESALRVSGGTGHLINGDLTVPTLWQSGGTLAGSHNITVSNHLTWTAGIMGGTGRTVVQGSAALGQGSSDKRLDGRTLELAGHTLWAGGWLEGYNGALVRVQPAGVLDLRGINLRLEWGNGFGARPTLENMGAIVRSSNTDNARIDATVHNTGTIAIAAGTMSVNGTAGQTAFRQAPQGTLTVGLEGTDAGQVHGMSVIGTAHLSGTLNISRSLSYDPPAGATFTAMTYSARTNGFTVTGDAGAGKTFAPTYGTTALTINVLNAPGAVGNDPAGTDSPDSPDAAEGVSVPPAGIWGPNAIFLPLVGGSADDLSGATDATGEQPAAYVVRYVGAAQAAIGQPLVLQARVRDAATWQPVAGRTVRFTVNGQTLAAVTDGAGIAAATLAAGSLTPGGHDVAVALAGAPGEAAAATADSAAGAGMAAASASGSVYVAGLEPAAIAATLAPGAELTVRVTGTVALPPSALDLVFTFDTTPSMDGYLDALKATVEDVLYTLGQDGVDVRAAIVSHQDYPGAFDSFGYADTYGDAGSSPYTLHGALTADGAAISAALGQIVTGPGGDLPTSYTRVLYESIAELLGDADPVNGPLDFRPGVRRAVVLFGDDLPHDDNLYAGIPGYEGLEWSTGGDPGRNAQMGDGDDLDLQTVLAQMGAQNTPLFSYHLNPFLVSFWDHWAGLTGGRNVWDYDDLYDGLLGLVSASGDLDEVRLQAAPGFEPWVQIDPAAHSNVTLPAQVAFDVRIAPPANAPAGQTAFTLDLLGTPPGGSAELLASQPVTITVATTVASVDLGVAKQVDVARPAPGEPIRYTVTYSNAGPDTAVGVVITDLVPSQLTGVTYAVSGVSGAPPVLRVGTAYVWDVAQLAPGEGGTITVDGTVDPALADGLTIGNHVAVAADPAAAQDSNPTNNNASAAFTVDGAPRVLSITRAGPNPTNGPTVAFLVTFSEGVDGVAAANFSLPASGVTGASIASVDGSGDTRTVTVNTGSGDGTLGLDLTDGSGVADAAGKPLSGLPVAGEVYTVDKTAPTVELASAAPDPTNTSPIPVTAQFSENVTGFDGSDVGATNAAVSDFVAVDGDTYTFNLVPTGGGTVTAQVAANAAADAAGNGNAASNTLSRVFDSAAPTLTLGSTALSPTNQATIPVTAQFSKDVTGFDAGDLQVTNATVGNFAGSGSTYTFDLTFLAAGEATVQVAAGVAQDAAGNLSSASNVFSIVYDDAAPALTLSSAVADPTNAAIIPVLAQFSEDVTGFDLADVIPTNATVENFAIVDGKTYTFDVRPVAPGLVTLDVAAGAAFDAAGSPSGAAQFSRTFDDGAPTVTITPGQSSPANGDTVTFVVEFSEAVTGFTGDDVVPGGTANPATVVVSGGPSVYTVVVGGMANDGTVTIGIPANAATDAAGNGNSAAPDTNNSITLDRTPPTVTVEQAAGQPDPTDAGPIRFTVTFNEDVAGFTGEDVTLGGTAGADTATVTGGPQVFEVAVTGMNANGAVLASVGAGVAADLAGNANGASTSTDNTVEFIFNRNAAAQDDSATTAEDAAVNIDVLANDSDPDNDPLAIVSVTQPANGSAAINDNATPGDPADDFVIYTPAPDFFGSDAFSYSISDGRGGAAGAAVSVDVSAVNDAPSFTAGGSVTVAEDSAAYSAPWATAISPGPANEGSQAVAFQITANSNPALFSVQPALDPDGRLTFTPAPDANGAAGLTVVLKDDGGTPGVDASAPQDFQVVVAAVNDAPSFTAGGSVTVAEDSGPYSAAWATAISPGPANESGQAVAFQVTANDNPALFSAGPAIAPDGTLAFTPAPNANGTARLSVVLRDNGAPGDASLPQLLEIAVTPVNDAPTFTAGGSVTVAEDSGPYSAGWATAISPGPADESGQNVAFHVTANDSAALFSAGPALAPDGRLSFTPASNASGVANLTVVLKDNGGAPGADTSAPQSLKITVTPVNDAPVVYPGAAGPGACYEGPLRGTITLALTDADHSAGSLTLSATSSKTSLVPNKAITFGGSGAARTMTVAPAPKKSGIAVITVTARDAAGSSTSTTVTVIVGTDKKETINGSVGADMIFGLNGIDSINANAGSDLLCGGNAQGVMNGGSGDDTLDGLNGPDTLRGGDGNDLLRGSNGDDVLEGGNGDDTLTGGSGADYFDGGPGNNVFTDFNPGQGDAQAGAASAPRQSPPEPPDNDWGPAIWDDANPPPSGGSPGIVLLPLVMR